MGEAFHVVCHECSEEALYGSRSDAVSSRELHSDETGHRVSMLDIDSAIATS
jgi:hypothetical protein